MWFIIETTFIYLAFHEKICQNWEEVVYDFNAAFCLLYKMLLSVLGNTSLKYLRVKIIK